MRLRRMLQLMQLEKVFNVVYPTLYNGGVSGAIEYGGLWWLQRKVHSSGSTSHSESTGFQTQTVQLLKRSPDNLQQTVLELPDSCGTDRIT